jgi:hypothetical protein
MDNPIIACWINGIIQPFPKEFAVLDQTEIYLEQQYVESFNKDQLIQGTNI